MLRGSKRFEIDQSEEGSAQNRSSAFMENSTPAPKRQRSVNHRTNYGNHSGEENGAISSDEDELESLHEEHLMQDSNDDEYDDEEDKEDLEESANVGVAGTLERVNLINFMCHDNLTINLGPQVNFITGPKGSGKSAILTAIIVALSGKATVTSQASAVESFVKQGKSSAKIQVWIRNAGVGAFKHDVYGDSIIVEGLVPANGKGSWKLKNSKGRLVLSKRSDLKRITDWYNILLDNPLHILTQDAARQFITESDPQSMYDFFSRGTHLSQFSSEYDKMCIKLQDLKSSISQKKQGLCDLKVEMQEASKRFENLKAANERKNKLNQVSKVEEATRQNGRSVEDLQKEVERSEAAWAAALVKMNADQESCKMLQSDLDRQMEKWMYFRRDIALRAKQTFSANLQTRNFEGNLRFDHTTGRLALSVKTDAALGQEGDKDPRSLSGGEKSYSKFCFLSSLWDAINSPIRCLDEYDVFMDAVNRRVSTRLIADAAKRNPAAQYILISPNSMQQAALGPEVRIHRLTDAERNQSTI